MYAKILHASHIFEVFHCKEKTVLSSELDTLDLCSQFYYLAI